MTDTRTAMLSRLADSVASAAPPASSVSSGKTLLSILPMNHPLCVGDHVCSSNGRFFAIMQADGHLCVYRGNLAQPGARLWGSQSTAGGGKFFTVLQSDGNLCTYRGADAAHQGARLWGSQVTAKGGRFFAMLQDDGKLCVYKGSAAHDNQGWVWDCGASDAAHESAELPGIAPHRGRQSAPPSCGT